MPAPAHPFTVLVVDDVPQVCSMLRDAIEKMGYHSRLAWDSETALTMCEDAVPEIVLTDIHMPRTNGLTLTQRIRDRWPGCAVIVMTGYSNEESAIAALKAGACDYLKKPINLNDLRTSLDGVAQVLSAERCQTMTVKAVERMEWRVTLANDMAAVVPLTAFLARDVLSLLPGPKRFHLRIALQEMLVNAIEHGNLAISAEEKAQALAQGKYDELVRSRGADPRYRARVVTVTTVYDRPGGMVRYCIRDQGSGFDWRRQVPPIDAPGCLTTGSGRGIPLARSLVSQLAYNDAGNEAIMTVIADRPDPSPSSNPVPGVLHAENG